MTSPISRLAPRSSKEAGGPPQISPETSTLVSVGDGFREVLSWVMCRIDFEDPVDLARLEAPRQTLSKLTGLVVIDEIQRRPDLFPLLRVLADRPGPPAHFLVLGSASPDLVKGVSESLAGRVGFVDLSGFDGTEVGFKHLDILWLRGGFPESFLSDSDKASFHWRQQFIRTFLTRDIPQLGIAIPAEQLRRFWLMIAHYHGQTWNASEIAGSLGINYKTAQHYLDILTGAFMIRSLPPWTENLGKRVRKAPKIYLRDSGLFHSLQNIRSMPELQAHPKLGASWEGLALEHVLRVLRAEPGEAFYWGTHGGAELDLMLVRGGQRWGFEFKFGDAPRTTKSMRVALDDLKLQRLFVIYPGEKDYTLDERIEVLALPGVEKLAGWRSTPEPGNSPPSPAPPPPLQNEQDPHYLHLAAPARGQGLSRARAATGNHPPPGLLLRAHRGHRRPELGAIAQGVAPGERIQPGKRSEINAKARRCKGARTSAAAGHHQPGEPVTAVVPSPAPCSLRLCLLASLR